MAEEAVASGVGLEGQMLGTGVDAIQPGARVFLARRGEGGSRQLLGVQTVGALLRRVLSFRQGVGTPRILRAEVRAEATQILNKINSIHRFDLKLYSIASKFMKLF